MRQTRDGKGMKIHAFDLALVPQQLKNDGKLENAIEGDQWDSFDLAEAESGLAGRMKLTYDSAPLFARDAQFTKRSMNV